MQDLVSGPGFFLRGIIKSTRKKLTGTPTYVVGFSTWKQYLRKYFTDRNLYFLPKNISQHEFDQIWKDKILSQSKAEIFVWGFKAPDFILDFAKKHNKTIQFVEDGFIRSIELGAQKAPPMSLTLDSRTPYFNSREASDLEHLLNTFDFSSDATLLSRAERAIQQMLDGGVSKYNKSSHVDIQSIYGIKTNKRILVIGQVEDDASIQFGCDTIITNNDLVKLAAKENPGAQIFYKAHPDVLAGNRPLASHPSEVKNICTLIKQDISLAQSFHEVDHVYTITSLSGFEALLRGIKVTTVGCPFYSGWGLTDDRQANARRTRKLTITELFAGAYLLYAKYFDIEEGGPSTLELVISKIVTEMKLPKGALPLAVTKAVAHDIAPDDLESHDTTVKSKPKVPTKAPLTNTVPSWFNSRPSQTLKIALQDNKPLFLYVPWIAGHGDALIEKILQPDAYNIVALDFMNGIDDNSVRQDVLRFTRTNPELYRKMVINRLVPLRNKISGIIFTFDWSPVMRLIASICEELQIPKILIPHESVFVDREKYYWDETSKASTPAADIVLGWGGMQKEIFSERGYPSSRFHSVGAPKFDTHINYVPMLTREQFCRLYGFSTDKKIVLFASQPLDSQLDKKTAQISQRTAISDLLNAVTANNAQLLVRLPPNKEDVLGNPLRASLKQTNAAATDEGQCYLVSPEEALHHADVVTSINSTMLFEALLIGRPALSLKYAEFDQIWRNAGIPAVHNATELDIALPALLSGDWTLPEDGMAWAAQMFGTGQFDGKASHRIRTHLTKIARGEISLPQLPTALDRLFSKQPLDVIAIPSAESAFNTTQRYVPSMLQARTCISTIGAFGKKEAASVEIFFQWGISESSNKKRQREFAKELGKPVVFIEDGFIRSLDIGLSKEPGLSLILDDTTAYYDATQPSRLARLLQSGPDLCEAEIERSRLAIDKIVRNRVSKYNHAPDVRLNIGTPGRKKVMLVDQRFGDQSVASGLGSDALFDKMLKDVLKNCSDCDILIKQHPDAIKGGKSSYFSNEKLAFTEYMDNVHPILFDVNPFALFDLVDDVYVMTSGMGFEALMAGKKVHCYGMPFYSGWGQTEDQQTLPSRTRQRTTEELFHFAYIESSRYFDPVKNKNVEVEDIVDHIVAIRDH